MEKKHTGLPWLPVHELSLEFGAFSKFTPNCPDLGKVVKKEQSIP